MWKGVRYVDQQWKDHVVPGYPANKPEQPVIRVSYNDAMEYCKILSQKTGLNITLPTEAQWEWACRGGSDGDSITFGHTTLEAIHVPGHSPGSLVYYCKEDNCMFSGDVLFQGSIGRADLTGGNFDELIEHICSRLFVLPNETVVYPGHGSPTTIGMEKAENPFFR